jgi:transposase
MGEPSTFVGLDAHQDSIVVARLLPGAVHPVEWRLVNEPGAVRHLAHKLEREAPDGVRCCYEAGPGGYVLQRQLVAAGIPCAVVAPSLIPVKPGQAIKTDRRDARKLAELFRAGLLTEVHPPTEDEEAVRDLCRARDDAQRDLTRAKNRLSRFLLRRGCVYCVGRKPTWSQKYWRWLHALPFERPADQIVFEDYLLAVEQVEARLEALDDQLGRVSTTKPYRAPVAALRCFHGIDTVTALALVAELHDPRRFPSARQLTAYLGLVPRENSSGGRRRQGGHHRGRQPARPAPADGSRVALPPQAPGRSRPAAAATRPTSGGDCARGPGAAPAHPASPPHDVPGQAPQHGHGRHRPRTGRPSLERPASDGSRAELRLGHSK